MKFFLTIKHWQLFSIFIGIPFLLDFMTMGTIFSGGHKYKFVLRPFITFILMGLFISWLWTVASFLHSKAPNYLKSGIGFFKFGMIYIPLYFLFFSVSWVYQISNESETILFGLIFPFHLFAMFCWFYAIYFIAKTIEIVEKKREVTFNDYSGVFFMLWFFPIGIWWLQPRINKIFQKE